MPHTADLIVEAWGPTLGDCLEEAVRGMVEQFADTSRVPASETLPVALERASPTDLLLALLEEVVYLLDVLGLVPVAAAVDELEDGGVAGAFEVAPLRAVEVVGAAPKAVARSGLHVTEDGGVWTARATIDV